MYCDNVKQGNFITKVISVLFISGDLASNLNMYSICSLLEVNEEYHLYHHKLLTKRVPCIEN